MKNIVTQIERKCHEKLMIYHELLNIFRKEKKSIINADVTALWKFSSEKHGKAEDIEKIRGEILKILNSADINHDMTEKTFDFETVTGLFKGDDGFPLIDHLTMINRVKKQIQTAGNANRLFIEEYLATINDLVNVMTGNDSKAEIYNQSRNSGKIRNRENRLFSREV